MINATYLIIVIRKTSSNSFISCFFR